MPQSEMVEAAVGQPPEQVPVMPPTTPLSWSFSSLATVVLLRASFLKVFMSISVFMEKRKIFGGNGKRKSTLCTTCKL
jgi:hypothetical protein